MTTYLAHGSPELSISDEDLNRLIEGVIGQWYSCQRVLIVPPDFTRFHSRAGKITSRLHDLLGSSIVDILPALGTHVPMPRHQREKMFPGVPASLFRVHDWRNDVETIGTIPADFVREATEGIYDKEWPAQLNHLVSHGNHDLIISVGQVVPHEVIGMANHNKNLFVGTGGAAGINESHYIGAVYGMERMMGRADTPLRRILNEAERRFCSHLPILYFLTVVGADESGQLHTRGLFVGDDTECFRLAAELSLKVNFTLVDKPLNKVVVYLDPDEFQSTWLGNKAIYRTRMAIADGGELTVLAPGVHSFGEDEKIDHLIRRFGYRTTDEVKAFVSEDDELRDNLSAAAHLIHGSPEGRFKVTYCPGALTPEEIIGVGYDYRPIDEALEEFPIDSLQPGWNQTANGESFFFVRNPAQGLWASPERLVGRLDSC